MAGRSLFHNKCNVSHEKLSRVFDSLVLTLLPIILALLHKWDSNDMNDEKKMHLVIEDFVGQCRFEAKECRIRIFIF